eukprot:5323411-Ditylum_brightwellii.AAC.1
MTARVYCAPPPDPAFMSRKLLPPCTSTPLLKSQSFHLFPSGIQTYNILDHRHPPDPVHCSTPHTTWAALDSNHTARPLSAPDSAEPHLPHLSCPPSLGLNSDLDPNPDPDPDHLLLRFIWIGGSELSPLCPLPAPDPAASA